MENLKKYSDEFKFKFEKFLIGCDSIEEMGLWDLERFGDMDVFYSNDITSIIVRLIAADGHFSSKEVEFLNDMFGFEYDEDEIKEIYEECYEGIESIFDDGAENGLTLMKSINEKLANTYKDLIILVCSIITAADGVIDNVEADLVKNLKADLEKA